MKEDKSIFYVLLFCITWTILSIYSHAWVVAVIGFAVSIWVLKIILESLDKNRPIVKILLVIISLMIKSIQWIGSLISKTINKIDEGISEMMQSKILIVQYIGMFFGIFIVIFSVIKSIIGDYDDKSGYHDR